MAGRWVRCAVVVAVTLTACGGGGDSTTADVPTVAATDGSAAGGGDPGTESPTEQPATDAPTAAPAGAAATLDIPYESPCEQIPMGGVRRLLDGEIENRAELAPGESYPAGLSFYPEGLPNNGHLCLYQGGANAEVAVTLYEPEQQRYESAIELRDEQGCEVVGQPWGDGSQMSACESEVVDAVDVVAQTASSIFVCQVQRGGSGGGLRRQVEQFCTDVATSLSR